MPKPRAQRAPPAAAAGGAGDEEHFDNMPPPPTPEEQNPLLRVQDPAQDQILRSMPNSLSRELKLGALGWRGGCFCCPATISFGQCMAGLWQAARKPSKSADSLVHWGLNASKFLFEAGPNGAPGRALLLRGGFIGIMPQLLAVCDEVPQSIALTPQVSFVQVFATGGKQLPLSTSPQLVTLGLMSQVTASPAGLRDVTASPDLIPSFVRLLAGSTDDRLRSLAFQTLCEWLNRVDGGALDDHDSDNKEEDDDDSSGGGNGSGGGRGSGGGGFTAEEQSALVDRLLNAGVARVVVDTLGSSANAVVLRDTCAFLLALLAGGRSSSSARGGGGGGHGGGRGQGMSMAGLMGAKLPSGAALDGPARGRARAELLQAGLMPALLSGLSRRPSQLRYWLAINMGVAGARLLEMQWLMLVVARLCLLPRRLAVPRPPAGPEKSVAVDGRTTEADSGSSSGAGVASLNGAEQKGHAGAAAGEQEDRERLRAAAAELVLLCPALGSWLAEVEPEGSAAVEAPAEAGGDTGEGSAATEGRVQAEVSGPATEAPAASTTERALRLLSSAVAASSLLSYVLPDGTPLEQLVPKERNITPDWRTLQRDRIRKAAEEARAAQAQASASSAVDVLSRAVAQL